MANPYKVCGGNAATGSATLVVTVTTTTTAGDAIAVLVTSNNNNISGVSDSKGNSYVQKGTTVVNGTIASAWFIALPENNSGTTTQLVATTDTITFTATGTGGSKTLSAFGMSGVVTSSAVDVTPTVTTGTSTSPSISSGVLAQASEFVLAAENNGNAAGALTWSAPFSTGVTDAEHNGTAEFSNGSVILVSSTSSVTATGTIVSGAWGMALISLKVSLPTITTGAFPNGTVGTSYSQTETESGGTGPFTWTVTGGALPTGLSLSSAGVISGTPTVAGTYNFTVQVADSFTNSNTATANQTIVINSAVAFPSVILDLQADMLINGTWTSVTGDVFAERSKPTIKRGRPDETSQAAPSTASFMLDNRSGNYSIHNPLGAYYGNINRNTPIRFHTPEPNAYARFEDDSTSFWSCPTSAGLNLAGDLDARIDLQPTNWTASFLCGKWQLANGQQCWALLLNNDGTLTFVYTNDGTTQRTANSTQAVPNSLVGTRFSLKVTYNKTTGAVQFFYASSINGTYTQIGNTVTITSGAIFSGSASVVIGYSVFWTTAGLALGYNNSPNWTPQFHNGFNGKVFEFQLRNGIGGSTVADPIFSGQANNTTSFSDGTNTWTANGTTKVSTRKFRFYGEMSDWPPRISDPSAVDPYIDATANGLLRRAAAGAAPLQSALTRAYGAMTGSTAPVAYWPCEDGTNSTQIASGLSGGNTMSVNTTKTNSPTSFASNSSCPGSGAIPVPNKGGWLGFVVPYTNPISSPATNVRAIISIPSGGDTNNLTMLQLHTRGTVGDLQLIYDTGSGGEIQMKGLDVNDNNLFSSSKITGLNGQTFIVEMTAEGTGTINWQINVFLLNSNTQQFSAGTVAGNTDIARWVAVNPNLAQMSSAIGQIAVQNQNDFLGFAGPSDVLGPFNAWSGELAGNRFARLCTEQGFNYRVVGFPSVTVVMGPQTSQAFTNLLQEVENADMGMLFEPRQALALGYNTYGSLCSQSPSASLSYTSAQVSPPIEPIEDDLLTVNDIIASKTSGGSSYEIMMTGSQYAATSALSTNNPPSGVGIYQSAISVNVYGDNQLSNEAGWTVHMGTVNELRVPTLRVDLSRSELTSISNTLQDVDLGDYVAVTNPPNWIGYDSIKSIIWGLTETLGGYIYTIDYNTQPESPWEIWTFGTGATTDNRFDTDGSTLHSSATSGALAISVDTTSGFNYPIWTTAAADFPFDIIVGGERMTVLDINGPPVNFLTGNATDFEGGIANWTGDGNTSVAQTTAQAYNGTHSLSLTSIGAGNCFASHCTAGNILTQGMACAAGDTILVSVWVRSAASVRSVQAGAGFYTAGGVAISDLFVASSSDSTTGWIKSTGTLTAPATSGFCRLRLEVISVGGASEVHYIDVAYLGDVTSGGSSQSFAVTRSVNGVVKAQSSGTAVNLFQPSYFALV